MQHKKQLRLVKHVVTISLGPLFSRCMDPSYMVPPYGGRGPHGARQPVEATTSEGNADRGVGLAGGVVMAWRQHGRSAAVTCVPAVLCNLNRAGTQQGPVHNGGRLVRQRWAKAGFSKTRTSVPEIGRASHTAFTPCGLEERTLDKGLFTQRLQKYNVLVYIVGKRAVQE